MQRRTGDTAHDGADAVYDRDAHDRDDYDPSEYQQPKDYDGDGKMGSDFYESDVSEAVAERGDSERRKQQFARMWYWNDSANPSYENPDGDERGDSVVQPSDDTGRRGLQDKLATVEWVADEIGAEPAVRSEARTLVASADGRGHCIEKVALGAVLVADDRFLRNKVIRADVDGPLQEAIERLEGDVSDREIDTILNLLESDETLSDVFRRRMKRWEAVAKIAERNDFKLNHAKAIFYE
ncbi:hypothetical protein PNP85_12590 [Halobacterium salinarum]|uniref:hypothetical protein n=1 Tax=Halobacterium salinarum TaxID=2242 RepID=UPI00255712E1|nr:hypothetical protein [Halobacterium salinarum]MDL0140341.1 hypothetical protein [Halobacterium salinarum]